MNKKIINRYFMCNIEKLSQVLTRKELKEMKLLNEIQIYLINLIKYATKNQTGLVATELQPTT